MGGPAVGVGGGKEVDVSYTPVPMVLCSSI